MPRLRVQDLLPVEVLILQRRALRRQTTVRSLKTTAHLPIHHHISTPHISVLFLRLLERVPHVLEGVGSLEGVEDAVVVAGEGALEGLGVDGGGGHGAPGRAVAQRGRRAAAVRVRHVGARGTCNNADGNQIIILLGFIGIIHRIIIIMICTSAVSDCC